MMIRLPQAHLSNIKDFLRYIFGILGNFSHRDTNRNTKQKQTNIMRKIREYKAAKV